MRFSYLICSYQTNKFCTTAGTVMYVYRFLSRDLLAVFNILTVLFDICLKKVLNKGETVISCKHLVARILLLRGKYLSVFLHIYKTRTLNVIKAPIKRCENFNKQKTKRKKLCTLTETTTFTHSAWMWNQTWQNSRFVSGSKRVFLVDCFWGIYKSLTIVKLKSY